MEGLLDDLNMEFKREEERLFCFSVLGGGAEQVEELESSLEETERMLDRFIGCFCWLEDRRLEVRTRRWSLLERRCGSFWSSSVVGEVRLVDLRGAIFCSCF